MTVYAIGATALIGGIVGSLDSEYVGEVHNGDPAFVTVSGDKIYHYMANSTSGAVADGINVIKPLWESEGAVYTGDLRWILHGVYGAITSTPDLGEYKVVDIRLSATKELIIEYNDTPES